MTDHKALYWVELSDYDFETAEAMLKSGRYLYVGFMAHQSVEKILKACYVKGNDKPAPFSHSLSYLAKKADIYVIGVRAQLISINLWCDCHQQ
jgi:HEPN domain-containing protein